MDEVWGEYISSFTVKFIRLTLMVHDIVKHNSARRPPILLLRMIVKKVNRLFKWLKSLRTYL